jgi:hypothetical protein
MPPSRKKAQGKARKAAKAKREDEKESEAKADATQAAEANQRQQDESVGAQLQQLQITGSLRRGNVVKECKHGFAPSSPEEEHICIEFLVAFKCGHNAAKDRGVMHLIKALFAAMKDTEEKYAHVWNDVTMMEKVLSCLLCIGTMHILDGNTDDARGAAFWPATSSR